MADKIKAEEMNNRFYSRQSENPAIGPRGSIYVENFKAYGAPGQYLPVSTINLFFGPNSSGKSSLFQALQLVGDYVYRDLKDRVLPPRRFSTLVHAGDIDREIAIGLLYSKEPKENIAEEPYPRFVFRSGEDADEPLLERIEVTLSGEKLCTFRPTGQKKNLVLEKIEANCSELTEYLVTSCGISDNFEILRLLDITNRRLSTGGMTSPIPVCSFNFDSEQFGELPEGFRRCLSSLFREVGRQISEPYWLFTSNLPHVASIRSIPSRDELLMLSDDKVDWVRDCQKYVWQLLLRSPSDLSESRFIGPVNHWMGPDGIDLGYKLIQREVPPHDEESSPKRYFVLQDYRNPALRNVDLDLADVGAGIAQVIPVLGACCLHNDLWIFVEQPELHLHPKAQAELGNVFARKIRHLPEEMMNMNNAFFLETHSEHLVLRLQKHIRLGRLAREEVTVIYTEPSDNGTRLHHLRLDEDGDFIDDWPGGFFNERLREFQD